MATIPLSQGMVTIVDDADHEWLSQWKWSAHTGLSHTPYAVRNGKWGTKPRGFIFMHREILLRLGPAQARCVDHIDRNGLNNQRDNLRWATRSQNGANRDPLSNSSGRKGVQFRGDLSRSKPWMATIGANNKRQYLGFIRNP